MAVFCLKTLFAIYFEAFFGVGVTFEALEDVHKMNIYHRDIKGENILLDSNFNVKLCDFGRSLDGNTSTDQAWLHRRLVPSPDHREVFGTPAYKAPEVLAGCDKRLYDKSDVFSLGCTLFLLVLVLDQTFR